MFHVISTHDLTKRSTAKYEFINIQAYISTHDLTKRSTIVDAKWRDEFCISTHDLTKRSTLHIYSHYHFQEAFQLTTSRRGRPGLLEKLASISYFNSRPHEEVDTITSTTSSNISISTHDLTKRSTLTHNYIGITQ